LTNDNTFIKRALARPGLSPGRKGDTPDEQPTSLADFKSRPPRVFVTRDPKDEGDREATIGLLRVYSDDDGFHCPVCNVTITNPDEAVNHLSEEINKAFDQLGRKPK